MGDELIDRVEGQELNSGASEDLVAPQPRADFLHHPVVPRIAIRDRFLHEVTRRVDEAVVNTPRIDADRAQLAAQFARDEWRETQPIRDSPEQRLHVPAKAPDRWSRTVVKTMRLAKPQAGRPDAANDDAPASRAEIH